MNNHLFLPKKNQLQLLQKQLSNIQGFNFDKKSFKNITRDLNYINKNDLISLRATYQNLFSKVIVQPLDESKMQLKFVFKEDSLSHGTFEDFYCISAKKNISLTWYKKMKRSFLLKCIRLSRQ